MTIQNSVAQSSCILPADEVVEKVMQLSAGEQPSECKCWFQDFLGSFLALGVDYNYSVRGAFGFGLAARN